MQSMPTGPSAFQPAACRVEITRSPHEKGAWLKNERNDYAFLRKLCGDFFARRCGRAYVTVRKTVPDRECLRLVFNVQILRLVGQDASNANKLRIFSEISDPACVAHVFFQHHHTGSEDELIVNTQGSGSRDCGGSKGGGG
jgi:hypothetical protein